MTFGAPLFLLAVMAGVIPVVLHLINRQNAPVVNFSTLRFLQISVQKTRRRKYVHDALLLVLRVLALALIAIALAQPAVFRLHQWLGSGGDTAMAIIIDNSASMASNDQNGPRWKRLVSAAEQVLSVLESGDRVALLNTNGPAALPERKLYRNHEVVRQALGTLKPSYERADLAAALAEAKRILARSNGINREIYVLTDLQATSWRAAEAQSNSEEASCPIVLINVGGPPLPNVSLARLTVDSPAPAGGVAGRVTADVIGDAKDGSPRHVQRYGASHKRDSSPTLQLDAGGAAKHTFVTVQRKSGLHRGDIRLDQPDGCPADDQLFFSANTNPAIPAAIVSQSVHQIPYLDPTHYLRSALMPAGEDVGAVLPTMVTADDLDKEPLAQFAVVFCVNLSTPSVKLADQLVQYLEQGGCLVWVCGDRVDPVQYSVIDDQVGQKLFPIRLTRSHSADAEHPDGWHVAWLDPENAITSPFAVPAAVYQSVNVRQYIEVPPVDGSGARVLARLDNGHPLLLEKAVGSGRVFLWTSSFHVQWTNLPLRPLFLPLMSRFIFEVAGTHTSQPLLVAGTPWTAPIAVDNEAIVEVTDPKGAKVRLERKDNESGPVRFLQTHQTGVYRVQVRNGPHVQQLAFAVNPDPEESAAAQIDPTELKARLQPATVFMCDDPAQVTQTIARLREGQSLWEFFLVIVLIALVAESFLANRRALNPAELQQRSPVPRHPPGRDRP